jgi:hypothetical protein
LSDAGQIRSQCGDNADPPQPIAMADIFGFVQRARVASAQGRADVTDARARARKGWQIGRERIFGTVPLG